MSITEDNRNVVPDASPWYRQAWDAMRRAAQWLNQRTGGSLTVLAETWHAFNEDDGGTHAAAVGYYALFSLFPLIVLLSLALTYIVGETLARIHVMLIVGRYLPTGLGFVDEIVQNVLANRGTLSLLALGGTVWGSMHIFRVLERSINQAWGAPRRRNLWGHLRFSAVMITITGMLTSISVLATALFRLARPLNLPFIHWAPLQNRAVWAVVSSLPPFFLALALFMLLYRFVPHGVRVRWREVWPSALLAALLWESAKQVFAFYMANFAQQSYSLLYGSIGVIIGLLTWVYLTGYIILLGAELCAVLSRSKEQPPTPRPQVGLPSKVD